ncbi:triple tyrosine motif-containing protein [Polaribacter sp. IC073]|uniref:helix-turn-helix and ligand-binding sensor domain-containing protein n=1 Tax=Polaribacter sp. IC073 TaxID=2508540 RepID=UPI0011BE9700|nr:triple tyrosine motif-containing protein [Polaribacter sp. IC073]TXD47236.1 LuxR family transcriptional regulator [Polaribacter sp. IC073]
MKKKIHTITLLVTILLSSLNFYGQELPPIKVFTTEDYRGGNQNWSISQATNKYIYVANNKGLLEYNGAKWHLYPTPNETIMRSVKCINNTIFTGFFRDFGFWEKNDFGFLEFNSIVEKKGIKMFEDEQIWEIIELDGWVLFKSLQRIYLYNLKNDSLKIIEGTNVLTKVSKVNDVVYFQDLENGLFKIENGASLLVSNHEVLKNKRLTAIFYKDDKLFFLTQNSGFYFFEDDKLKKWKISANSYLENKTIYSAEILSDDAMVLGTISDGVIYLTSTGDIDYQINQNFGLSNNTVLSVFEDLDKNIWLGLDNGINLVNFTSPLKIFVNQEDFLGTIYTSTIYNGNLYLGTNQGLFFKKHDAKSGFTFIKKTQGQVWSLEVIDGTLFCGHDSGTFIIKNNEADLIFNLQGSWGFKKLDKNLIIQGTYDGLYVLEKENKTWRLRNKIKGFKNSSRYFIILENDRIFVNHEYKGVFKLKINDSYSSIVKIEKDTSVQKGIHSSLLKYKEDVFYASKKGVYKYNFEKNTFGLDSVYSRLISENTFVSAKLISDEKANKLWSFTSEGLRFLTPGKLSNTPTIETIPIKKSLFKGASGFENIIHLENEKYLLGTINGYLIVDLNKIGIPKNFEINITQILNYELDQPSKNINLNKEANFRNKENSVAFFYSVPKFDETSNIMYQYKLAGYNSKWSDFSKSNSILFENLPFGNYNFRVRALVSGILTNNLSEFKFRVEKPWFLSNLAVLFYTFVLLLLIFTWYFLSKKYYNNKQKKLLLRAQQELELKELESSQKIIKLNNDKLRNDIASKNRELATSTMSIIKKNEFLSTIKKELLEGKEKNISNVVKVIDKNLNNTDDWKMFQEAFNNADKKFLDKVKDKHPSLTPNDLRLCAYLRLNLSSKEIAPLLNISPRSVEVKRYRLRKKMDLDHNANLTNYILEI